MIIKLMNVAMYGHNLNYTALPTFGMKNLSNIATHDTSKCVVIYNEYMRNYCLCTCSSSLVCMYPYSLLSTIRYHLIAISQHNKTCKYPSKCHKHILYLSYVLSYLIHFYQLHFYWQTTNFSVFLLQLIIKNYALY